MQKEFHILLDHSSPTKGTYRCVDQHVTFSTHEWDRINSFVASLDRLDELKWVADGGFRKGPFRHHVTGDCYVPEYDDSAEMDRMLIGWRRFLYTKDLSSFLRCLNIVYSRLSSSELMQGECNLIKDRFTGKVFLEDVIIPARRFKEADQRFRDGLVDEICEGYDHQMYMSVGGLTDFDAKAHAVWLYGHLYHDQKDKRVEYEKLTNVYGEKPLIAANIAWMQYQYQAFRDLRNTALMILHWESEPGVVLTITGDPPEGPIEHPSYVLSRRRRITKAESDALRNLRK